MPDETELPSTRRMIEQAAAGSPAREARAADTASAVDADEDFRRIIAKLRAVLQVREE